MTSIISKKGMSSKGPSILKEIMAPNTGFLILLVFKPDRLLI